MNLRLVVLNIKLCIDKSKRQNVHFEEWSDFLVDDKQYMKYTVKKYFLKLIEACFTKKYLQFFTFN